MATLSGYLDLGTAVSGAAVIPPGAGTGYVAQPISFSVFTGGVTLNNVSALFGPVLGSWGTLTVFGVSDSQRNPVWAGTLSTPFTPVNGQIVAVPAGNIQLVVGTQFAVGPGISQPTHGILASGSAALASGAYTQILTSGNRNALSMQNTSSTDTIKLIVGDLNLPLSGAVPSAILPPYGKWPSDSLSAFVPSDAVWGISGQTGTVISYLTG